MTGMSKSISGIKIRPNEEVLVKDIRPGIQDLIRKDYPNVADHDILSIEELNRYRRLYLTTLIEQEHGDMAKLDLDVMEAINGNSILSENIEPEMISQLTIGQRLSDRIASFGGSWTFILAYFAFIFIWLMINVWILVDTAFDPYPFILLNLILSCIAAIQAPIIMMSQNRQEQKDRIRSEHDYKINLKAELEIKLLSDKMDHLLAHQNRKLIEIQEVQIDYLEDLLMRLKSMDEKKK